MKGFKSPNHTQVPNDFFDMIAEMSEAELRVTLIMIRETRGWHRDATKLGKAELAKRSGLSYNGVTAGCEAAELRGTFKRTNPEAKTRAEWELISIDEPSIIEGVNPQPMQEKPSTIEGRVGVKESTNKTKKIKEAATPKLTDIPELVLFRSIVKHWPKEMQRSAVIEAVQKIEKRLGRPVSKDDIEPFWKDWGNVSGNEWSLVWLVDWAVNGKRTNGKSTSEPKGFQAIREFMAVNNG